MYKNIYNDRLNGMVYVWDDQSGMTRYPASEFRYAYRKKKDGKYKSLFGDELEKIEHYDDNDPDLFESDLNVEMKVLLDLYPNDDEISKDHRIVIYDIETSTEGGFPDITLGDKEITAIALYDVLYDKYYSLILDKERKVKSVINGNQIVKSFDTEEALLTSFIKLWREINPNIISGWNINYFDNPFTYNRIKAVLGKSMAAKLSPINIAYQNKHNKKMVIAGISSLDYIELYKKFLGVMKSSYSLSNVAKDEELKHQKLTYKGNLDDLYKNDINRFIEYNLVDVKVVAELDKKYDFINLAQAVCHKGHIPYEWFQMSSRFIDGAIINYLHSELNLIAPNKPVDGQLAYAEMEKSDEEGFEGAYVKEPVPGFYNWVCSADITSLYPSAIMTLNISPETKVGKIENWSFEDYNNETLTEVKLGDLVYTIDEFKAMIANHSLSIASGGTVYKQNKAGVIPTILDRWFEERVQYRKLSLDCAKNGDKEKEAFYDRRQKRQKIFLNSVYGTLGLPIFRFYDKDNAEAVTLSGQSIIKGAERIVNDLYDKKFKALNKKSDLQDNIIYIDTDSVYFSAANLGRLENIPSDKMTDYTIALVNEAVARINKFYDVMIPKVFNVDKSKNRIKIVADVIAQSALWIAKKRYAMLKVYDMEKLKVVKDKADNIGKLEVKGIDTVRSSYPPAFRKMVSKILESILRNTDIEAIDEDIMKFEEKIQTFGQFDLAKTSSIKYISKKGDKHYNPKGRGIFELIKGSPATAKAGVCYNDLLKVWKLERKVDIIRHGDKARWIYLMPNPFNITQIAFKGDDTDPDEILEFIATYADKKGMYEKELKTKLDEIYEAIRRPFPNRGSQLASKTFNFTDQW